MLTTLLVFNLLLFPPQAQLNDISTMAFHLLIVSPTEEIIFRFFIPLVIIYFSGLPYVISGFLAALMFGMAHWWAYQQNLEFIMVAVLGGVIQTLTVYLFSDRDAGEWEMPMDALAYYSISVIVFLFSMIGYLYQSQIENVLVYVIYAVTGVMSLILGYFIIGMLRNKEADGFSFKGGLLGAILAHGLYNIIVSSNPQLIIPMAMFAWIVFGLTQYRVAYNEI
jgi:RsiW-degrading membrane proteinase PrsW (M82 family)